MSAKPNKQDLEQLLSSYIDGECSDQERRQVEEGLQRDPQLRALYTELVRTVEAVRATPAEAAPGRVRERILAQLERRALLDAAPRGIAAARSASWARLGLVAAAMLVTGVGVTWWYRTHQPRTSYQIAMAPTQPEQDAVRKAAPEAPAVYGRDVGVGRGPAGQVGETSAAGPVGATGSLPARALVDPASVAGRDADRTDSSGSDKSEAPGAAPQDALAMRGEYLYRSKAPEAAEDRTLTTEAQTEAAPSAEPETAEATTEGFTADVAAQRLAPGRAMTEAARPAEPAASPGRPAALADHEATTGMASARMAAGPAAPPPAAPGHAASRVADMTAKAMAAAKSTAAGRREDVRKEPVVSASDTVTGPPVTRLQVTVADARHVTEAAEYIRAAVARESGRAYPQRDPSILIVTVPAERQQDLADIVVLAPGVTRMRSSPLLPTDPLARQASALAAGQWAQEATRFLEALDSAWQFESPSALAAAEPGGAGRTADAPLDERPALRRDPAVSPATRPVPPPASAEPFLRGLAAAPAVPEEQAALVIVIESAPAAARPTAPASRSPASAASSPTD